MGKKNKANALGRSLIKDRFGHTPRRTVGDNETMLHTTEIQDGYDWGRLNLQSVTEESSFQDFLRTAELAGTEFQAEKLNLQFLTPKANAGVLSDNQTRELREKHKANEDLLKIPRRPKWTAETTGEELQKAENEAFLEWRRGLSVLQEDEGILMTPYEKNLEFWRQLWRVVEKSDVIIQIVDARNPLLFRSEDLEKYVKEVDKNKMNMILINKADLLTEQQRVHWADFFDKEGMRVAFFSAILVEEENQSAAKDVEIDEKTKIEIPESDDDDDESDEEEVEDKSEDIKESTRKLSESLSEIEEQVSVIEKKLGITQIQNVERSNGLNDPKLLSRAELIEIFKTIYQGKTKAENLTTIGLVGYPNVGKSSTINALMQEKKVSVSATPGKTKHFQTLFLDKDILLCDCPGLVMPSFVLTKADMVLNGILPIDQLRDHVPPVNLLCSRIPRHVLEDKYGIIIAKSEDPNKAVLSEDLLLAYGYNRGFMTSNGQPDQSRSARYVLKDYVNGKLLYCHAPPAIEQSEFHTFPERVRKEIEEEQLPKQHQRALRIDNSKLNNKAFDKNFFQQNTGGVHIKGRGATPGIWTGIGSNGQPTGNPDKPWKKQKREKREKLRNKFVHLDLH